MNISLKYFWIRCPFVSHVFPEPLVCVHQTLARGLQVSETTRFRRPSSALMHVGLIWERTAGLPGFTPNPGRSFWLESSKNDQLPLMKSPHHRCVTWVPLVQHCQPQKLGPVDCSGPSNFCSFVDKAVLPGIPSPSKQDLALVWDRSYQARDLWWSESLGKSFGWPLLSPGWLFTQEIMSRVGKAGCQLVLMASVGVAWAKSWASQAKLRWPLLAPEPAFWLW